MTRSDATPLERRRSVGRSPRGRPRSGHTLLEVQIAFALLGIGLAGLCQLVVMQLRQVRVLEKRLQGEVVQYNWTGSTGQTMLAGQTYYLVPWQNPLAQKFAGSAQIGTTTAIPCDPGPLSLPATPPQSYSVNVVELDAAPGNQTVTAYVDVSAP